MSIKIEEGKSYVAIAGVNRLAEEAETETLAWNCDKWPAWLREMVDKTNEASDRLGMSTEQAHAYGILSAVASARDEIKSQRRRATDAEYLSRAYYNMLGEKGLEVARMWRTKGVKRVHVDWGEGAGKLTGEERAQVILDSETAPRRLVEDIDAGISSAASPAPVAVPAGYRLVADADVTTRPLDLSLLLRHAFISGRGLKDGDRLSEEDQAAWIAYEPQDAEPFKRVFLALYPGIASPVPSTATQAGAVTRAGDETDGGA